MTTDNLANTDNDNQKLANQLCHRFYVIANAITRKYKPMLDKINLTYPQYVAMMALWEKDKITISKLQQKTLIDIGCLSVMLKKMVDKQLIEIITDSTDRRKKTVKLTTKGKKLKPLAQQEKQKLQAENQPNLTDDEFNQLVVLLDKLKSGLIE
ncbi:MAG: winged helix-turn-helix transcriptional regulator [Gammaproteobacteria bacterium]|nr:winged helix-turn-helix transcriptional regulator [Gammaproteobacteria bacterium]